MTDDDLEQAIARALARPGSAGLSELEVLHERVQGEREPLDPALARTWDALVRIASRSPDDLPHFFRHAEGRARWLSAARGPAHPDVIAAWVELGETADLECEWALATRAWEAVASAPADGMADAMLSSISRALRGLAGRRIAGGRLDEARVLFERDLALNEQLHRTAHPQLAISHENLALVLEQLGERARALAERALQRDVLAAGGANEGQLAAVDQHLARLRGA